MTETSEAASTTACDHCGRKDLGSREAGRAVVGDLAVCAPTVKYRPNCHVLVSGRYPGHGRNCRICAEGNPPGWERRFQKEEAALDAHAAGF